MICAYLFSSTKIASKVLPLRFSGKCSPPSSHMIWPAFDFGSSVFPSGRVNLKWASLKKTGTEFGVPMHHRFVVSAVLDPQHPHLIILQCHAGVLRIDPDRIDLNHLL